MGLALIGKPQEDLALLKLAHAYEMANQAMIAQQPPSIE
jgi:amidase